MFLSKKDYVTKSNTSLYLLVLKLLLSSGRRVEVNCLKAQRELCLGNLEKERCSGTLSNRMAH